MVSIPQQLFLCLHLPKLEVVASTFAEKQMKRNNKTVNNRLTASSIIYLELSSWPETNDM